MKPSLHVKVLILKPSSLGDIIHALPVLRLIKQQRPHWKVHWWIAEHFAPILEMDRDVAALHHFHRNGWGTIGGLWRGLRQLHQLRKEHFDVVIDLQGLARSALFSWVANGSYTIGLHQHREGAAAFYDVAIERPTLQTHAVDWCQKVLPALGLKSECKFEWIPSKPWIAKKIAGQGYLSSKRWIALCPGARWPSKQWPLESFSRLMEEFNGDPQVHFVVVGGANDKSAGNQLGVHKRCLDLTGQTTLPELVEWLRKCDVLVTNDTGPMHIAAAVGTSTVSLFGPTDPHRTGPYQARKNVLHRTNLDCVPCFQRYCTRAVDRECLQEISPVQVFQAIVDCE
jgi:lipopolysaccharide heptosyltransferase I